MKFCDELDEAEVAKSTKQKKEINTKCNTQLFAIHIIMSTLGKEQYP